MLAVMRIKSEAPANMPITLINLVNISFESEAGKTSSTYNAAIIASSVIASITVIFTIMVTVHRNKG